MVDNAAPSFRVAWRRCDTVAIWSERRSVLGLLLTFLWYELIKKCQEKMTKEIHNRNLTCVIQRQCGDYVERVCLSVALYFDQLSLGLSPATSIGQACKRGTKKQRDVKRLRPSSPL